jgi:hypothetical protein
MVYAACLASETKEGSCIFAAGLASKIISRQGPRCIIQAGTACWPRIYEHQDDGVSSTHFSYVWEHSPTTMSRISQGLLPEMHAWCAIPETNEIIDMTTIFAPIQCKKMIGEDWPGPRLPAYIWATPDNLPDNVIYKPYQTATILAMRYASSLDFERYTPSNI